jgi:hypothetical protein
MFKVVFEGIKNLFKAVEKAPGELLESIQDAGHKLTAEVEGIEARLAKIEAAVFPAERPAIPINIPISEPPVIVPEEEKKTEEPISVSEKSQEAPIDQQGQQSN